MSTDNGLPALSSTQTFVLTVQESNRPPALTGIASFQYPALTPLALNVMASDPDLPPQPLSYSAAGLPAGLSIHPTTGQISGSAQTPGVYPVSVFVGDNQTPPLSATNAFTLTVTHPFVVEATSTIVNGQPQLKFWAVPGGNYDIQYSPTLSPVNWQVLQHITNSPGGLQSIPTLPASTQNFVRVVWFR